MHLKVVNDVLPTIWCVEFSSECRRRVRALPAVAWHAPPLSCSLIDLSGRGRVVRSSIRTALKSRAHSRAKHHVALNAMRKFTPCVYICALNKAEILLFRKLITIWSVFQQKQSVLKGIINKRKPDATTNSALLSFSEISFREKDLPIWWQRVMTTRRDTSHS